MSTDIRIDVRCTEYYEIDLHCKLPYEFTMDDIDDKLFEAGYGDAFVCHNGKGSVSITFNRKEISKFELVRVTRIQIKQLFPEVEWLADSK